MIHYCREATLDDAGLVSVVGARFFRETFEDMYTEEDLTKFQNSNFTKEIQTREFQNLKVQYYLLMQKNQDQDDCIAYLKLEEAQPDGIINVPQPKNPLGLARIYMSKESQGKGLGGILMNKAIERAKAGKHDMLWLGVWPENTKAIKFYNKFGFHTIGEHEFLVGDKVDIDVIMAININP